MPEIDVDQAGFDVRRPGDVILQAGDEQASCFYGRLSLLAELSNFFACLPSPNPNDLVDGTPLIPLHGTTSTGLLVFLSAVKSTTEVDPYLIDAYDLQAIQVYHMVIEATIVAKTYDTPVVFRILSGCLKDFDVDSYLDFALWSIADHPGKMAEAAEKTLDDGEEDISGIHPYLVEMCQTHAPAAWSKLLHLHLRYIQAPKEFHRRTSLPPYTNSLHPPLPCGDRIANRARIDFAAAETVRGILAIGARGWHGSCLVCNRATEARYREVLRWLKEFGTEYEGADEGY